MSSLQDQLLKAGLVDPKKLAEADREKKRKANLSRKSRGKKRVQPDTRPRGLTKKEQRDRELNRQRQEAAKRRELEAQVKQLIVDNRQDRAQGEHPYGFVYKRKVKKIFVTEAQRKQLVQGRLAIATYVASDGRKFELVPRPVAAKIAQRDSIFLVDSGGSDSDADDAYADYQVPDDLIW